MQYFEAIWKSIILGTVQGLTEILPVSSSGHLSLLQRVLHYKTESGSMTLVNVTLHLGTLFAVIWVLRRELLSLFQRPFKRLFMLLAATVPAGVAGLLFGDKIDALFAGERGIAYLALFFSVTAGLLLITEFAARRRKKFSRFGWRHAAAMGCMQAVALFPGLSRSGATVFAGTVCGAERSDVARFSFLMSIPVILGSAAVELGGAIRTGGAGIFFGGAELAGLFFGVVFAAASGVLSVKVTLGAIEKANYKWFSLYLVLLSLLCLWLDVIKIF